MPNEDGTGPDGKGPRTGRGQGKCAQIEEDNNGLGPCGNGRPRRLGRGRGRR